MNMYQTYWFERDGSNVIETSYGFVRYLINRGKEYIYAIDVYVVPEMRKKGYGAKLMDMVAKEGEKYKLEKFYTSVDKDDFGHVNSLIATLTYGKKRNIRYSHSDGTLDYYLMEI